MKHVPKVGFCCRTAKLSHVIYGLGYQGTKDDKSFSVYKTAKQQRMELHCMMLGAVPTLQRGSAVLTCLGKAVVRKAVPPRFLMKALKACKSIGSLRRLLRTASRAGVSMGPLFTMNFQYDLGRVSGLITYAYITCIFNRGIRHYMYCDTNRVVLKVQ